MNIRGLARLPIAAATLSAALTIGAAIAPAPSAAIISQIIGSSDAYVAVDAETARHTHSALMPEMASIATAAAPSAEALAAAEAERHAAEAARAVEAEHAAQAEAAAAAASDEAGHAAQPLAHTDTEPSAPAAHSGAWSLNVTGYCDSPYCAQSAVDSYGISFVDYTTGFQTFAGHMEGPAGIILSMHDGDIVDIPGYGTYRITYSTTVPETATTNDVAPGLALQTCMGNGQMMVRYLAAA